MLNFSIISIFLLYQTYENVPIYFHKKGVNSQVKILSRKPSINHLSDSNKLIYLLERMNQKT